MDVLPSCVGAASCLGLTASHAFVYLARVLQETCMKVEECTDGDALISVVVSRPDGAGGVLLFASGFVDGQEQPAVSGQAEGHLSAGVDSMVSALQMVASERQAAPPRLPALAGRSDDLLDAEDDPGLDHILLGDDYLDVEGDLPVEAAVPRSMGGSGEQSAIGLGAEGSGGASTMAVASTVGAEATLGLSPSAGTDSQTPQDNNILSANFTIPMLTVPPPRILMSTGSGAARKDPPAREARILDIPDELVADTVKELLRNGLDVSLRTRLRDFTSLYKFVIDTLVKREFRDLPQREKVNHTYPSLTPEALRNTTVRFKMPGSTTMLSLTTPTFQNSHCMTVSRTLAIILFMKHQGDAFFLFLLVLFRSGTVAPVEVGSAPSASTGSKTKSRKRKRPSSQVNAGKTPQAGGGDADPSSAAAAAGGAGGAGAAGGVEGAGGATVNGATGGVGGDAEPGGGERGAADSGGAAGGDGAAHGGAEG